MWLLASASALAQSAPVSDREVLLGTIEARGWAGARESDRGHAAGRLLADAMAAFDGGEVMLGRRRLELLAETFPETLAAATARRELARLLGGRRQPAAAPTDGARGIGWAAALDEPRASYGEGAIDLGKGLTGHAGLRPVGAPQDLDNQGRQRRAQDERRQQALAQDFQATAGDRVFFGETDAELGARARTVLAAQARWFAAHAELAIEIEAHADDGGSADFNFKLAERRGRIVRERLIAEGIAPERITLRVLGSERPVATCTTSECAAQNRRVVTIVGSPDSAPASGRAQGSPPAALTTAKRDAEGVRRD